MCKYRKIACILLAGFLTGYSQGGKNFKAGAGYGNGFGMFGAGLEFEMSNFALLGGVGSYLTKEIAYDVGLRYYIGEVDKTVRTTITASYGPTQVLDYTKNEYGPNGVTVINKVDQDAIIFGLIVMGGVDFKVPTIDRLLMNLGLGIGFPLFGLPPKAKDDFTNQDEPDLEDKFRLALGLKYLFPL